MKRQAKNSELEADKRAIYFQTNVKPHKSRYQEFHAPSVEVLYHLFYTYDVFAAHLARQLGQHNLSLSAFNVLLILGRSETQSCALSELSELLVVSRANITGLVDSLEKRGLVKRTTPKEDRRVKEARITPAGQELLKRLLPDHYLELRSICAGLTQPEKTQFVALLTKLRRGLQVATSVKAATAQEK